MQPITDLQDEALRLNEALSAVDFELNIVLYKSLLTNYWHIQKQGSRREHTSPRRLLYCTMQATNQRQRPACRHR